MSLRLADAPEADVRASRVRDADDLSRFLSSDPFCLIFDIYDELDEAIKAAREA